MRIAGIAQRFYAYHPEAVVNHVFHDVFFEWLGENWASLCPIQILPVRQKAAFYRTHNRRFRDQMKAPVRTG